MICRCCGSEVRRVFLDLGASPAANSFLASADLDRPEPHYPLVVHVCDSCHLVQIGEEKAAAEIFNAGYVYFSSCSEAFVRHAQRYARAITAELGLGAGSLVVEAASNDGYLLQHFKTMGIPALGVEPSASTARVARDKGIETLVEFFTAELGRRIAAKRGPADLFVGNNVVAHVPNLADFLGGIAAVLKPKGTATLEFPHLLNLIRDVQFDTVYHEHFSYFSLLAFSEALRRNGLYARKVEELPVHGGSLRVYCAREGSGIPVEPSVGKVLDDEIRAGLDRTETYAGLQARADAVSRDFLAFLCREKANGATIAGYGAAAKGNTLLNYCGVKPFLMDFVADVTPAKQGMYLPGSRIPVLPEAAIFERKPDFVVILPWNWEAEIRARLAGIAAWGGRFVTAIPSLRITPAR